VKIGKIAIAVVIAVALSPVLLYFALPSYSLASMVLPAITNLTVVTDSVTVNGEQVTTPEITISVGDRVRTSTTGRALITFFEGSSTLLEPDTDITVEELIKEVDGSTTIILFQELGSTWSRVRKLFDTASNFNIETVSAVAIVRGTALSVNVDQLPDGSTSTEVAVSEGTVDVDVGGKLIKVPSGKKTKVKDGQAGEVLDIPDSVSRLSATMTSPAWLNVIDPLERNAGLVFPGFEVNEVPLCSVAYVVNPEDNKKLDEQSIVIHNPISGIYKIAMHAKDNGVVKLTIAGESNDDVFSSSDYQEIDVVKNRIYVVPLQITMNEEGEITDYVLGDVIQADKGQGNKGNQGNSGTPGNSGNQGNSGTPGNSGNQGNSGTPGNSGNQGNSGTPGDSGTRGNSGNSR